MDRSEASEQFEPPAPPSPWLALLLLVAGPATLVAASAGYLAHTDVDLVRVGLAGTPAALDSLMGERRDDYVAAAELAWLPVIGFLVATVTGSVLGHRVLWTPRARGAAAHGAFAALLAGGCALLGAALLVDLLRAGGSSGALGTTRAVQAFTVTATSTATAAATVAIVAWAATARRLAAHVWRRVSPPLDRTSVRPPSEPVPPGRPPASVGVCASGGGIRSACLTLGALQALAREGELSRAAYLVSVSGGSYTAGAFQLALAPLAEALTRSAAVESAETGQETARSHAVAHPDPAVFAPGSVEEDYLRRHSNYIADGRREWMTALAVVFRGVVVSLAITALTVAAVGLALGAFYAAVPVLAPGGRPLVVQPEGVGVRLAIGGLFAAALLLFLGKVAVLSICGRVSPRPSWLAGALTRIALLGTLLTIAVPALAAAAAAVPVALRGAVPTGAAAIVLTYASTLAGILWRNREAVDRHMGRLRGWLTADREPAAGERAIASSLTQQLLVVGVLLGLGLLFLLGLGWVVATAPVWPVWAYAVVLGALAFCALLLDQTWLSLHPFYRQRLASAFAVHRVQGSDGRECAAPYDVANRTLLSRHGRPVAVFPQVIFAAAANLSGADRTPPGRRATSFTLSHDWIGGPDVGWVRTERLERTVSPHLQRDLTVLAAMAISGAAFASAMGRQARAYETLFALSNARLGAWLPNPAFLHDAATSESDWRRPQLPRIRRLSYLLREVAGSFPYEDRLLYCTDGGHYENLGLVELLRHRCRTIYCIDASGDTPPLATTLAEAITLAREIGVEITLDHPLDLVPGGTGPLQPVKPLAGLSGRLSRSGVVTGTIRYPEPFDVGDGTGPSALGRLVVVKASLTADLPYDLLAYAAAHPVFPRDSTGDQWFDHGQFDAYQTLGRELATRAVQAVRRDIASARSGPTPVADASMRPPRPDWPSGRSRPVDVDA